MHIDAEEALEQDNATPTFPRLFGVAEVALELGVSKQRVHQLTARPDFPPPITELAAGPVWLATSLARFVENWERKPGRPKSKANAG